MTIGKKLYGSFGIILIMVVVLFCVNWFAVQREHAAKSAAQASLELADTTNAVRFQMMHDAFTSATTCFSGDTREGKRMPQKVSEIVIQFRPVPHWVFPGNGAEATPDRLIIRVQPDEHIRLNLWTKEPGPGGLRLRMAGLNLSFAETFKSKFPDAYRAAPDGRGARQRHPLHAPRRGRGGLDLDRPDPRRLGRNRRPSAALHRRHLGAIVGHRAHRARQPDLV